MSDPVPTVTAPLVLDYLGLAKKYRHEREVGDRLLELAGAPRGWRDCRTVQDPKDQLKPFSNKQYRRTLTDVNPRLFDYAWNHLDQTQYLHWSVYHILAEWIFAPDARGYGAMNVGIQEVPATGGPMHQGLLDVVFASWDDPRLHCGFPIESHSALLMRFWNYDAAKDQFTARSVGPLAALLIQWNPIGDTGVELWTSPLTRDPTAVLDDPVFVDADMGQDMPHENEESSSWSMAIRNLGRRHRFDPAGYRPLWTMGRPSEPSNDLHFDRFAIEIASEDEAASLSAPELERAYDALWQRYLAVKMLTDFTVRHAVRGPAAFPPDLKQLYETFPIVGE